ncbi:MAG: ATP-binding cassette domain-containing protein, partial [Cyanobacteria bacterium P01_H01_bin.130]
MAPAILACDVQMTYQTGHRAVPILKGVDLAIHPGNIQLLMGPSGSGKTTLLSILAGILTPTGGAVRLLGEEITQLSKKALADFRLNNIGFIFQGFNLFPALTARENIE